MRSFGVGILFLFFGRWSLVDGEAFDRPRVSCERPDVRQRELRGVSLSEEYRKIPDEVWL